jgi:hypothetical protein
MGFIGRAGAWTLHEKILEVSVKEFDQFFKTFDVRPFSRRSSGPLKIA